LAGIGRMGTDMKKLILVLILALLPGLSFAGSQEIRSVVGMAKVQGATYTTVFSDDFNRADSGTVGGSWTSESDIEGKLGVVSNALHYADDSATASYIAKTVSSPGNGAEIKVAFDYAVNDITWAAANKYLQIAVGRTAGAVSWSVSVESDRVFTSVYNEASTATSVYTNYSFVADTTYTFEVFFRSATGTGVSDGYFTLKINGAEVYSLPNFGNYGKTNVDHRFGPGYTSSWTADDGLDITLDNYNYATKD